MFISIQPVLYFELEGIETRKMQVKNEKGHVVIEKCRRCGCEMPYWIEPSRNGEPYNFDRICGSCITPQELSDYYRLHGIKPYYCAGGCGSVASRHDRYCPRCKATRAGGRGRP